MIVYFHNPIIAEDNVNKKSRNFFQRNIDLKKARDLLLIILRKDRKVIFSTFQNPGFTFFGLDVEAKITSPASLTSLDSPPTLI